ncbi:hypothetical protein F5X96DRAFT_656713 [Biscogniauxia mediterranea]|nr:hypothetical protein F5X96DRAFT_656713 [Biscogniauxia mediterranea]
MSQEAADLAYVFSVVIINPVVERVNHTYTYTRSLHYIFTIYFKLPRFSLSLSLFTRSTQHITITTTIMHPATPLALAVSALLPHSAAAAAAATKWSFTFYDSSNCTTSSTTTSSPSSSSCNITNSNSSSSSVFVNGTGDVACAPVPGARLFGSVLGAIPAGSSGCAIHLFVDGGCGSRLAYGLTEHTDECAELGDQVLTAPLRSYAAVGCE